MKPFVKWAGGKTQLLPELLEIVPDRFGTYVEPFVGGGALLLALAPDHAIINDANRQLMGCYRAIRDNLDGLVVFLEGFSGPCDEELYYGMRERYNEGIAQGADDVEQAGRLIWLNHHCFNGLYRTNRKGLFNTPWNRRVAPVASFDARNLEAISSYLRSADVTLLDGDYGRVLDMASPGDFVFLDPPYAPIGGYADFKRYTKEQFGEADQRELAERVLRLHDDHVSFCLTNSDADIIHELYDGFDIRRVSTRRNVSSKGDGRRGTDVIIVG